MINPLFTLIIGIIVQQVLSDQADARTTLLLRKRKIAAQYVPMMLCPNVLCDERPSTFVFQLTGSTCSSSLNDQGEKFTCDENISYDNMMNRNGVYIRIVGGKNKKNNKKQNSKDSSNPVYFNKWVSMGDSLSFSNNGSKFPADMQFELYTNSQMKVLLQSMNIHTSCSKNLYLGDKFGSLKLVGLRYENGDDFDCEVLEPTMAPSQKPSISPSHAPSNHPSVNPTKTPSTPPSVKPSSTPTKSPSASPSSQPSSNPSNKPSSLPSVSPSSQPTSNPSMQPSSHPSISPSTTPSFYPSSFPTICPRSQCAERPKTMTFMFDGRNCQSSSNSQNEDLFLCVDYDALLPNNDNVFVVFSDLKKKKDDKNKSNKKQSDTSNNNMIYEDTISNYSNNNIMIGEDEDVYFKGFLTSGVLFDVSVGDDNDNSKKSKLPANMNVNVYSNSSNYDGGDGSTAPVLLQSFSFHSSCSKNLFLGDQFGSMKLVGFEYNDGTVDKCY